VRTRLEPLNAAESLDDPVDTAAGETPTRSRLNPLQPGAGDGGEGMDWKSKLLSVDADPV
jgi:hypothetical protein